MSKVWDWLNANKGRRIVFGLIVVFFLLAVISNLARAADYTVTCTPPTERADGTPLTAAEIAEYRWFVDGSLSGTSTDCSYLVTAADGTYQITATTVDTGGRESVPSVPFALTLTTAAPNPPSALQ